MQAFEKFGGCVEAVYHREGVEWGIKQSLSPSEGGLKLGYVLKAVPGLRRRQRIGFLIGRQLCLLFADCSNSACCSVGAQLSCYVFSTCRG